MAYFNHAFTKIFLGTGTTRTAGSTGAPISVTNPASTDGFITTVGTTTATLSTLDPGYFGFFDPNAWTAVNATWFAAPSTSPGTISAPSQCCPLVLASASLLSKDKLNQYIGGYKESNKSKTINPRYVQKMYRVDSCVPQQSLISIGTTPQTGAGIATLGATVLGTETYVNGTYTNINLTGGTGSSAKATVVVVANAVSSITLTSAGIEYTAGNVLTLASAAVATPGSLTELVAGTSTTITVATAAVTTNIGFQGGTTEANCCYNYLCGETYYLRIDIKGSPALRFLNHNAYQTLSAYTGCCPSGAVVPVNVDPTTVYITWAKALVLNNYLKDLVAPVVYDYTGVAWYAPGTTVTYDGTNTPVANTQWWTSPTGVDQYAASAQAAAWTNECTAGMRLFGAYVETKFGNCSFQITDFFEKEPVRLYASLVDYNGDPCVFEGLCVYNDCLGIQGMGFGEQVVRDLIKAESYLQNFFSTDIRIREITQGNQILDAIDRNALYTRYFILHSVPRFNNPSGTFDNDRYLLEIITNGVNAALETFLEAWSTNCPACAALEGFDCTHCDVIVD
jgi:hypothetical protein